MSIPKPKTYRNKAYLAFVRSQPCLMCGAPPPTEAHHERQFGDGGVGIKPPDTHAVPLCRVCHVKRHAESYSRYWGAVDVKRRIIVLLTAFMSERWQPTA